MVEEGEERESGPPSLSPRRTLWHDLTESLPSVEHDELRSILGSRLVGLAEDLRSEYDALREVYQTMEDEAKERRDRRRKERQAQRKKAREEDTTKYNNNINTNGSGGGHAGARHASQLPSAVRQPVPPPPQQPQKPPPARRRPLPRRPSFAVPAADLLKSEISLLAAQCEARAKERGCSITDLVGPPAAAALERLGKESSRGAQASANAPDHRARVGASASSDGAPPSVSGGPGGARAGHRALSAPSPRKGSSGRETARPTSRRPASARPSQELGGLAAAGGEAVGVLDIEDDTARKFTEFLQRDVEYLERDVEYLRELIEIAMDDDLMDDIYDDDDSDSGSECDADVQIAALCRDSTGPVPGRTADAGPAGDDGLAAGDDPVAPPLTAREVRELGVALRAAMERVDIEDQHNAILERSFGREGSSSLTTNHASSPRRSGSSVGAAPAPRPPNPLRAQRFRVSSAEDRAAAGANEKAAAAPPPPVAPPSLRPTMAKNVVPPIDIKRANSAQKLRQVVESARHGEKM